MTGSLTELINEFQKPLVVAKHTEWFLRYLKLTIVSTNIANVIISIKA